MFKKENLTTTIVVFIILAIVGLGIYGSMNKNGNTESNQTIQTTTDKGFLMEEQPIIGKEGAKAELQLFFDYMCSHCANWELTVLDQVEGLIKDNEEVALRFVNYQFMGQNSIYAGIGGEIVNEYAPDQFVNYSKEIFEKQINVNKDYVVETVAKVVKDLTKEEIEVKMDEQKYMDHVLSDKSYAEIMGVTSTPTLMLNGQVIADAFDFNVIKEAVEAELSKEEKSVEGENTETKAEETTEVKEEKGE